MEVRSGIFVDWLSISQEHPDAPVFNDGQLVFFDPKPGDPDGTPGGIVNLRRKIEGSFETSVAVRSDGRRVEFSGNPSRWCRPDNVFGLDLAGCLEAVNSIMGSVGLPLFTAGDHIPAASINGEVRRAFWTGARVSRIDLTQNFEAGSEADGRAVLTYLKGQQVSGARGGLFGETTVQYSSGRPGSGRRSSFKVYLKGAELLAHGKGSPDVAALAAWASGAGLLRAELTLRSTQLGTIGAAWLGDLLGDGMANAKREFEKRVEVFGRHAEGVDDPFGGLPRHVEITARRYADGVDVRPPLMSRATFYKHRKALLARGIDIAVPPPVRLEVPVRPIIVRPAVAPSWYSFARTVPVRSCTFDVVDVLGVGKKVA